MFSEEILYQDLGSFEKITFLNSSNSIEELLMDVPYGMKLLNSYANKQQYHSVHVGTLNDMKNHENFGIPISTLVKGYRPPTWKLVSFSSLLECNKQLTDVTANSTIESVESDVIDVIIIEKESLIYHSVPYQSLKSDIYGIVSTLKASKIENKRYIKCEYCTILPYGKPWLLTALSCISDEITPPVHEEVSLEEWEEVDPTSETNTLLIQEIKSIIGSKANSNTEQYLKSSSFRKAVLKMHRNLTNDYLNTTDVELSHHNNNFAAAGIPSTQIYIVSNLSLGTDSNKRKSKNKLYNEFGAYGEVVGMKLCTILELAVIEMRHFSDVDGNATDIDGFRIDGSPIDLDGLYINDKGIIVYRVIPHQDAEIPNNQKALKLDKLPIPKSSEQLEELKKETYNLFSSFGEVHEIVMLNSEERKFDGKAFVNFKYSINVDTIKLCLALNDIWIGRYRFLRVSLAQQRVK
jgi:hypothetical protein